MNTDIIIGGLTFNLNSLVSLFKILLLILAVLYFIFSLVVVRQVSLMTETLITNVSPAFRVFSIIFAIISLAVVVLFITLL